MANKTILKLAFCLATATAIVACSKDTTTTVVTPAKDYSKATFQDVAKMAQHVSDTTKLAFDRVKALRKK